jgi:hypothetical protein
MEMYLGTLRKATFCIVGRSIWRWGIYTDQVARQNMAAKDKEMKKSKIIIMCCIAWTRRVVLHITIAFNRFRLKTRNTMDE